jgi:hypothetical protein
MTFVQSRLAKNRLYDSGAATIAKTGGTEKPNE